MWITILKPKSPENNPKNAKKQQPTETQTSTKTEISLKVAAGPVFTFRLPGGGAFRPSGSRQLRHWL